MWNVLGLNRVVSNKKSTRKHRTLLLEALEDKLPMAGNITAVKAGTVLTLTGDTANNYVYLTGTNGNVSVTGQGTKVNNSFATQNFTGIRSVEVYDKGGSDGVTAVNLNLADYFFTSLDSGGTAGNDSVSLTNVTLGGTLLLRTDPIDLNTGVVNSSAGADVVNIYNVTANDDAYIEVGGTGGLAGIKNDVVTVTKLTAQNVVPGGESQISTGGGSDLINLNTVNINNTFVIRTDLDFTNSTGSDRLTYYKGTVVGGLTVITDGSNGGGTGNDYVSLGNVTSTNNFFMGTSGGNDTAVIDNSTFGVPPTGNTTFANEIDTSSGFAAPDRDSVTITRTRFFGGLDLFTGADNDVVNISTSLFVGPIGGGMHSFANLGDGDDVMYFIGNTIDNVANFGLLGGNGRDYFFATANRTTLGANAMFNGALVPDVETFASI